MVPHRCVFYTVSHRYAILLFNVFYNIGKVIFLAPTKPLVNQQINACHDIMGIPEEDIAHLEGSVVASKRETLWTEKRVFFCTPQTLMNDLTNGRCNPKSIVCIVIDEAHRATGQYAYTTAIQEISMHSVNFRVLALSATPGSDARKVQAVRANNFRTKQNFHTNSNFHAMCHIYRS